MNYPIQVVVRETGLSAHVIRIWEKRYGAVVPGRTETRRRSYSDADLHRLKLLRQATLLGHPIGSVAKLPDDELEQLANSAAAKEMAGSGQSNAPGSAIIRECIEAVKSFDPEALKGVLERATLELGHTALLRQVIAPLAHRLGDLWSEGVLKISHEHFATAFIRAHLLNPARQYSGANATSVLVAATPQGQLHELGAVMAAALAAEQGWRAIFLGPSLPASEIAGVAIQNQARAVTLSIIYPEDDPNVERELHDLRRFLPETTTILAGGRAAACYRAAIESTGSVLVHDLAQLQAELAKIRATSP
jgi:DNA-binding transcriptional MerR regulator/methylmalonyl-CoA mutase cobalamin-binding subunit